MTTDSEPIPGSVFTPRQVRTLKRVVVVLTALLFIGFAFLIAGLYYQASKIGEGAPSARAPSASPASLAEDGAFLVDVPPGTRVERILSEAGRVVIHLRGPETEEILVLDPSRANSLTRLRINPK